MRLRLFCCFLLPGLIVAPNCAENKPWNAENIASFYERFHPSEFSHDVRSKARVFLSEFAQIATALEEHCLGDCISSKCRTTIVRGGVLLRHVLRFSGRTPVIASSFMCQVLDQIDDLREQIACSNFPCTEAENMINILHSTHFEIQRPAHRNMLIILAEFWSRIPR